MNKQELLTRLDELGTDKSIYSLDDQLYSDNSVVLEKKVNHYGHGQTYEEWRVFFYERGYHYDEKTFYSADDAYDEVYNTLKGLSGEKSIS